MKATNGGTKLIATAAIGVIAGSIGTQFTNDTSAEIEALEKAVTSQVAALTELMTVKLEASEERLDTRIDGAIALTNAKFDGSVRVFTEGIEQILAEIQKVN